MASNQKTPPETLARAADLIAQGMSVRRAARQVGISHATLLKWLPTGTRSQHDTSCARLCAHWKGGACGLGFPREDWSVSSCGSSLRRS
jgi:DNA invertase Pin-like site-specific DNA recombinase